MRVAWPLFFHSIWSAAITALLLPMTLKTHTCSTCSMTNSREGTEEELRKRIQHPTAELVDSILILATITVTAITKPVYDPSQLSGLIRQQGPKASTGLSIGVVSQPSFLHNIHAVTVRLLLIALNAIKYTIADPWQK